MFYIHHSILTTFFQKFISLHLHNDLVMSDDAYKLLNQLKSKKESNQFYNSFSNLTAKVPIVTCQPSNKQLSDLIYHHNTDLQFDDFKINQEYFCLKIQSIVKLTNFMPRQNLLKVSKGNIKLDCKPSDLKLLKYSKKNTSTATIKVSPIIPCHTTLKLEVDCRGMRLSEFEILINQYILSIQNEEIPYVTIIHGHGDGILKNWLRKQLGKLSSLKWSSTEGNDGSTNIQLVD